MQQAPSSIHSFHWREASLVARAYDLGPGFGASLNLSHNGYDAPIVIFFDDLEYCERLAQAITATTARKGATTMTTVTAPLVGMRHHEGASEKLDTLGFGDGLILVREPENAYDENAIKVFSLDETFLGYIAREYASDWAPHFDSTGIPPATLTFGSEGRPRVEITFGEEEAATPAEESADNALPES